MAIHRGVSSMLKESLSEMVLVAEYCVNFRKDQNVWGNCGCYGYPAAVLLFAIADSVGSYVIGGNTRQHFDILKHRDYYNLNLSDDFIGIIYKKYRNSLTHNTIMEVGVFLNIGDEDDFVFEIKNNNPVINLLPFLIITKKVVSNFLKMD